MADKPKCLCSCLYFGWGSQLRKACFHPEDPRYLTSGAASCKLYVADDAKPLPGKKAKWPDRLEREEFFRITEEKN